MSPATQPTKQTHFRCLFLLPFLPASFSGLLLHGPLSWIPNCIIPCDEACPDAQPCPVPTLLMQKSSRKRKNDYGYWHDKCSLAIFTGRGYLRALRGEDTEAQHSPGAKQPRSDDLQSCPRDHSYMRSAFCRVRPQSKKMLS